MKKLRLMNVYLYLDLDDESDYFTVDKYNIYPPKLRLLSGSNYKKHTQNAFVEFNGSQYDSILFRGGIAGDKNKSQKRKLIDDVLVVGSILNGWNWVLYSRKDYRSCPVIPCPYLENIELNGKNEIEGHFNKAMNKINDVSWQKQYENGFHLIMLLNHANITTAESRFLSNIVIWEWLYPHLKNPNGATPKDEIDDLKEIIHFVLKHYWPNMRFTGNNIFHVLRNQLAHSGKLPINRTRSYVENWMSSLDWESNYGGRGIKDYILFFDKLTQIIVLKTLGIDAERIIQRDLNQFLNQGRL